MLEVERVHQLEHRPREVGRVVGGADRLVGLAEAGQVDAPPRGSESASAATVGRKEALVPPRPCAQISVFFPAAGGEDREPPDLRVRTDSKREPRLLGGAARGGQEAHAHVQAAADAELAAAEGAHPAAHVGGDLAPGGGVGGERRVGLGAVGAAAGG